MKKISEIQNELKTIEILEANQLSQIKGGVKFDDKRRQRPGGGTSTTSPSMRVRNNGIAYFQRTKTAKQENSLL
jgi:hypothetical protein